ncbi:MAG TPA: hypothetical protein DCQ20_05955 [Nitrospira sp.]|nr:hypothetical protein [Nitrospira sp.]HAN92051.1 hypothetical protein [Nitrospira sp.]
MSGAVRHPDSCAQVGPTRVSCNSATYTNGSHRAGRASSGVRSGPGFPVLASCASVKIQRTCRSFLARSEV